MKTSNADKLLLLLLVAFALLLVFKIPNDPCQDDTYVLDRDLFPQSVRDRCEKPRQEVR